MFRGDSIRTGYLIVLLFKFVLFVLGTFHQTIKMSFGINVAFLNFHLIDGRMCVKKFRKQKSVAS